MTELEELTALFDVVNGCCLMDPVFQAEDVAEVVAWAGDHESFSESDSMVIVKLKDGEFGMFTQFEDYTGHGCQCDSATFRNVRLGHILSGIDNWDLMKLFNKDNG